MYWKHLWGNRIGASAKPHVKCPCRYYSDIFKCGSTAQSDGDWVMKLKWPTLGSMLATFVKSRAGLQISGMQCNLFAGQHRYADVCKHEIGPWIKRRHICCMWRHYCLQWRHSLKSKPSNPSCFKYVCVCVCMCKCVCIYTLLSVKYFITIFDISDQQCPWKNRHAI